MAEILIRRKSKRVWPWVLAIVAVLAIIVWLVFGNKIQGRLGDLQTKEGSATIASRHLRYIPQVMVTRLETYLA